MPRFLVAILLLACSINTFAEPFRDSNPEELSRAEVFRAEHGFYASPAGAAVLEIENRHGWRDAQRANIGMGSFLFLGSAVEMLIGLPEERRAGRLFAEMRETEQIAYDRLYRSLAEDERRARRQRSVLSLLLGAGLLTGGLFANPGNESGAMFSMLGAGALGGSFLSWVLPGYYQSRSKAHAIATDPAPSFQFGVSSLLGQGGRISAALLF